jgi:hypothetical protein
MSRTDHETKVTTLWNQQMKSHRTIRNIKQDNMFGVMIKGDVCL